MRPAASADVARDANRGRDAGIAGCVERVASRTVFGWAWDSRSPDRRVTVSVWINGLDAGEVIADRFRGDLASAGIGDGRHGFAFPVAAVLDEVDDVEVRAGRDPSRVLELAADFSIDPETNRPPPTGSNRPLPPEWEPGQGCSLPSFFLLGAAKCGTTALHYYLRQHPGICMSIPKEPYYFEDEYERGARFYFNRYFAHWEGEPVAGESRQRNLYLPFVAPRIHAHTPNARLVVVLRNPAERLVSDWWHWHSRGLEPLELEEAVEENRQRLEAGLSYEGEAGERLYRRNLNNAGTSKYRTYLDSGHYAEQLARYLALFPYSRLHVVWSEDLRRDPQAAVAGIVRFLGADPGPVAGFDYTKLNQSKPGAREHARRELLERLLDHYEPHNRALEAMTGESLDAWREPFGALPPDRAGAPASGVDAAA